MLPRLTTLDDEPLLFADDGAKEASLRGSFASEEFRKEKAMLEE